MDSLELLVQGQKLTDQQQAELGQWMLSDVNRAIAFGLTPETVQTTIQQQAQLLPQIYPQILEFWQDDCQISSLSLPTLWLVWMPLAWRLAEARRRQQRPYIQGILGMQGAGKTTLTRVLKIILQQLGYRCCCLSLDDFYKTYAERQQLQADNPRLRWRGPPGTHDVDLGIRILDQFRGGEAAVVQIPRFNKSAYGGQGDRHGFEPVPAVDIVLFEGWFVGARPIDSAHFEQAPAPIYTAADCQFAAQMNQQLYAYLPLWDRLDSLIVLNLADYRLSKRWRQEAERKAIAAGKAGMSDAEVDEFVDYFWQALHPELFVQPLVMQGQGTDLVMMVNVDHGIGAVYDPARISATFSSRDPRNKSG